MKRTLQLASTLIALFFPLFVVADEAPKPPSNKSAEAGDEIFKPEEVVTSGVAAGTEYQATAGTLIVHPRGWDDVKDKENKDNPTAVASMFYVAYTKKGAAPNTRPVTFLYNGGPGSSSVWLHMGSFGPKRVITSDDSHTPAAPYKIIDNDSTLLDVTDLVFIDAPGTGFSRVAGRDAGSAFYGVDQDAYAFAQFIQQYLSKYGRWNSPKFLFGESYGTPRSAALVNLLQSETFGIDCNGVILLSQVLNFDLLPDLSEFNPSVDTPYILTLPTFAASAWYHHKLPGKRPDDLNTFLKEVEHFATNDYALALVAGSSLPPTQRTAIAEKIHQYTGLTTAYILKANLRVTGGEFEKNLQDDANLTTGRLDARFSGPTIDPLSKDAEYDPQSSAISSAYISAFNEYVRKTLNYGQDRQFKPLVDLFARWDFKHRLPNVPFSLGALANVLPDLSLAMKTNPNLKVMVLGGYFDIATPYYQGIYEMHHLSIPDTLQTNISYHYYPSGHMVYANEAALKQSRDDVAAFIKANDNLNGK